jgi:hypothetical protein
MSRSAVIALAAVAAPLLLAQGAGAQTSPTRPRRPGPATAPADRSSPRNGADPQRHAGGHRAAGPGAADAARHDLPLIVPAVSSRLLSEAGRAQNLQKRADGRARWVRDRVIERVYLTRIVEKR